MAGAIQGKASRCQGPPDVSTAVPGSKFLGWSFSLLLAGGLILGGGGCPGLLGLDSSIGL